MLKSYRQMVPAHLRFLLAIHVLLLVIYTSFRYVTLLYNRPSYFFDVDRSISLWKAFRIGLGFDISVASYALIPPYLALTYTYFRQQENPRTYSFVRVWCGTVIIISIALCAADIPYFKFFNVRLNTAMVHLKNLAQSTSFLVKDIKYYPVFLVFILALWGTKKMLRRLWNNTWSPAEQSSLRQKWAATAFASIVLVYGLWGGPMPHIPNMKVATFSNDGFINQLTLNPVHTWFDSYFDFDIHLVRTKSAINRVQKSMGIAADSIENGLSPILRNHRFSGPAKKMNVVLILMESMSADKMGAFGNPGGLTPGLDRICKESVLFDQCYSNGIHTNVGIYSSLYGMPAMMMQHPMMNAAAEQARFTGLPVTLREKGYQTRFYCTHPKTFDNLDLFLDNNGFDYISDLSNYPTEQIANAWGVGDESLMSRALMDLDSMSVQPEGKPFFTTLLTISTHPPFTLPAFSPFKPTSIDPIDATYQYADWAISSFIDSCKTKPWYQNTIFVLVGDHGMNLPNYPTDVPLSYNHVPLVIHAPALFSKPAKQHGLANQTDIFPTIMGLLNADYTQNTLGYDLFREHRPIAFFSQDHRLCALDGEFLYVARKSGSESLYRYREAIPEDLLAKYPARADSLKNYACSQIQVAQWLVANKLVWVE